MLSKRYSHFMLHDLSWSQIRRELFQILSCTTKYVLNINNFSVPIQAWSEMLLYTVSFQMCSKSCFISSCLQVSTTNFSLIVLIIGVLLHWIPVLLHQHSSPLERILYTVKVVTPKCPHLALLIAENHEDGGDMRQLKECVFQIRNHWSRFNPPLPPNQVGNHKLPGSYCCNFFIYKKW